MTTWGRAERALLHGARSASRLASPGGLGRRSVKKWASCARATTREKGELLHGARSASRLAEPGGRGARGRGHPFQNPRSAWRGHPFRTTGEGLGESREIHGARFASRLASPGGQGRRSVEQNRSRSEPETEQKQRHIDSLFGVCFGPRFVTKSPLAGWNEGVTERSREEAGMEQSAT